MNSEVGFLRDWSISLSRRQWWGSLLIWLILSTSVKASFWLVPGDFATVQGALRATNKAGLHIVTSGDSIALGPGIHQPFAHVESDAMDEHRSGLSFYSTDGPDATIIDANMADHAIEISSSNCSVEGLTLINARQEGLSLAGLNHRAINLRVHHCGHGILTDTRYKEPGGNHRISQSLVYSNAGGGIVLVGDNSVVNDVTVCYNRGGIGLGHGSYLSGCQNMTILNSLIFSNEFGITVGSITNVLIAHNRVFGCDKVLGPYSPTGPQTGLIYDNAFYENKYGSSAQQLGKCLYHISKTQGVNIIGGPYLGGNYYDDYAGHDLDGDGIGDTLLPYKGFDPLPLMKGPPVAELVVLSLTGPKTINLPVGDELWPRGEIYASRIEYAVTNVGKGDFERVRALFLVDGVITATNDFEILMGGYYSNYFIWDPRPWMASLRGLVAKKAGPPGEWGRLETVTNATLQLVVDPENLVREKRKINNLSSILKVEAHLVPDLAVFRVNILQVNESPYVLKFRPMMVRAYLGLDGLSRSIFSEVQGVYPWIRFNDGNTAAYFKDYVVFQSGSQGFVLPSEQADQFRTCLQQDPEAMKTWLYTNGVDSLNLEYDPKRNWPKPIGEVNSTLEVTATITDGSDRTDTNNSKTAQAYVLKTSPLYTILYKPVRTTDLQHRRTIRQHKQLMKQHSDFIEATFPVVEVHCRYDDDDPKDDNHIVRNPFTLRFIWLRMPRLSWRASAFRSPKMGGWMSSVFIMPRGALGAANAGVSYPLWGWGVYVDEVYQDTIHVAAHEIFHSWTCRSNDDYGGGYDSRYLAGEGWDVRGKVTRLMTTNDARFVGRPRQNVVLDINSPGLNWKSLMGNHLVRYPWIRDVHYQTLMTKMVIEGGARLWQNSESVAKHQSVSTERHLLVGGQINSNRVFTLFPIEEADVLDPEPTNGILWVECRAADDRLLRPPVWFDLVESTTINPDWPEQDKVFGFSLHCPLETAKLVFKDPTTILHVFEFSAHPPVVSNLQTVLDAEGLCQVSWNAEDPDGDALEYECYYYGSGSDLWLPLWCDIVTNGTTYSMSFSTESKPGGPACQVAVVATDGINRHRVESAPFVVPCKPPAADILAPDDGYQARLGEEITFVGFAHDADEGMLISTNYTWHSSRDGELGRGMDYLRCTNLTEGTHTITLTVVDRDQASAQAHIQVQVSRYPLQIESAETWIAATGGRTNLNLLAWSNAVWTASTDVPWIQILPPVEGSGSGHIEFEVAGQYRLGTRLGHIMVGELSHPVYQYGLEDNNENGYPDLWENQYATLDFGYGMDSDGDGIPDQLECWAGSDPTDIQSALRITHLLYDTESGQMSIAWSSETNRFYMVSGASELPGTFRILGSNLPATPPLNWFVDTNRNGPMFYRIQLE